MDSHILTYSIYLCDINISTTFQLQIQFQFEEKCTGTYNAHAQRYLFLRIGTGFGTGIQFGILWNKVALQNLSGKCAAYTFVCVWASSMLHLCMYAPERMNFGSKLIFHEFHFISRVTAEPTTCRNDHTQRSELPKKK